MQSSKRTGVQIDITDEGAVSICGVDQHGMDEAKKMIKQLQLILKQDRSLKVQLSALKNLVHLLSLLLAKKEWFIFPRSVITESIV